MKLSSGLLALRRGFQNDARWRSNHVSQSETEISASFCQPIKAPQRFQRPQGKMTTVQLYPMTSSIFWNFGGKKFSHSGGFSNVSVKISAFDWSKTLKTILRAASSNASWNWNININPENEKLRAEGGFSDKRFGSFPIGRDDRPIRIRLCLF